MNVKTFAYSSFERAVIRYSSSGGAFHDVANDVLRRGGVVFGAKLNDDGSVSHAYVETENNLAKLMRSKYVYSSLGKCLPLVREFLLKGREVLFVGTPCQVASVRTYLGPEANNPRLLLVDFVCGGAPHPRYWKRYLEICQQNPADIVFRDKGGALCWQRWCIKIGRYKRRYNYDPYIMAFLQHYTLIDSCFACRYLGENRFSDITIGDAWGIEEYAAHAFNPKGTSLLFAHTKKGLSATLNLTNTGALTSVPYELAILHNETYRSPIQMPSDYSSFNFDKYVTERSKTTPGFVRTAKGYVQHIIRLMLFHIRRTCCGTLIGTRRFKNTTIGIVTHDNLENFGGRLQNFALISFLHALGLNCININQKDRRPRFSHFLYHRLTRNAYKVAKWKKSQSLYRACKSSKTFCQFVYRNSVMKNKKISSLNAIIFGSDQVWNWKDYQVPLWIGAIPFIGSKPTYYSFSASFGDVSFTEADKQRFAIALSEFASVSVREAKAVDVLANLGVTAKVHLDPVFLLSPYEWDDVIRKYGKIKQNLRPISPFILSYGLGGSDALGKAKVLAQETSYDVIDVSDFGSPYFAINHFSFVKLIRECHVLVTDSFHAFCFACIYGKRVLLLGREGMQDRFEYLFSRLGFSYDFTKPGIIEMAGLCDRSTFKEAVADAKRYLEKVSMECSGATVCG